MADWIDDDYDFIDGTMSCTMDEPERSTVSTEVKADEDTNFVPSDEEKPKTKRAGARGKKAPKYKEDSGSEEEENGIEASPPPSGNDSAFEEEKRKKKAPAKGAKKVPPFFVCPPVLFVVEWLKCIHVV